MQKLLGLFDLPPDQRGQSSELSDLIDHLSQAARAASTSRSHWHRIHEITLMQYFVKLSDRLAKNRRWSVIFEPDGF
jgi:hypothetical protein